MRIGTAEPGSTFLTQGQALAGVLLTRGLPGPIEVLVSPGASIDNARRLAAGEIEFGFMAANWIGRAKRGEPPFTQPIDLRLVAPMNAGPLFFIARADGRLRTFADLHGQRVCVGPETSGMTQHAHTIFAALGGSLADITPVYLSFADGAAALARGEIDAQLQCPIPNTVMTALDAEVALRVLDYAPAELDTLLAEVPFYRRTVMTKGALRALTADVAQPGVLNVLVCHATAEADMVREVAGAIAAGAHDLVAANALYAGLPRLLQALATDGTQAHGVGGVHLHDVGGMHLHDVGGMHLHDVGGVHLHDGAAAAFRTAGLMR